MVENDGFSKKSPISQLVASLGLCGDETPHILIDESVWDSRASVERWLSTTSQCTDPIPDPVLDDVPGGVYVAWKGFAGEQIRVVPDSAGGRDLLALIGRLCNYDSRATFYLERWIAQIIREPAKPPGVCVVIRGMHESGRNILFKMLTAVMGERYTYSTCNADEDVFSRFNSALKDKVLIALTESEEGQVARHMDLFKSMISERTIYLEGRGVPARLEPAYFHFLVFSNNDFPAPVEGHMVCIQCKEVHIPDDEAEAIYTALKNDAIVRSLHIKLLLMNTDVWDPRPSPNVFGVGVPFEDDKTQYVRSLLPYAPPEPRMAMEGFLAYYEDPLRTSDERSIAASQMLGMLREWGRAPPGV